MDHSALSGLLRELGCPAEKVGEMATQLDRRAGQLANSQGRTHDEALIHLLRLMAGGWAAQARLSQTAPTPDHPMDTALPTPPSAPTSVEPWPTLGTRHVGDFRIFTLRSDIKVSPRTGRQHDFYVIHSVDWVNVIALTPDRRHIVMVEQYRHGSNTIELEVPGGMMDPEEQDPVGTAVRELREETGYEGESPRVIGTIFPNAAIMDNRCHTILIENCELRHSLELDHGEDLAVRLVKVEDLPSMVARGEVRHVIAVSALYHFELWQRGLCPRMAS